MKINEQTIRQACNQLAEILIAKNHDYGNSVEEQFQEYGELSLAIRLDDKLRRFKQLQNAPQHVKNESKADTLLDTAGYSILGYILLSSEEEDDSTHPGPLQKRKGLEFPRLIGPFTDKQIEELRNSEGTWCNQNKPVTRVPYHDQDHQY